MGNDAVCLEKQGECGVMADAMPVASVESGDSLLAGLSDKVDMLTADVMRLMYDIKRLEGTFDVWQRIVEPVLNNAEILLQRDSNLISFLAITIAIAIAIMSYIYNRKKEDAVSDAIKEINESLEKGVLPEKSGLRSKIIGSIINTDEFKDQVVSILDKYSTFSSKSSYENIDKTGKTRLDTDNLGKDEEDSNTNNEG